MISVRVKRRIIIASGIILFLAAVVILFISPFAKYLIQKNSEKWFGRQVKMGWLYLNPLTGNARIKNLKIFEPGGDTIFFSAKELSVSVALLKILGKSYEIKKLSIDNPVVWIIQNKKQMNFDDLIKKFTPVKAESDTLGGHHFNILRISIKNGEFHYVEKSIPVNYFIKNVNIDSPGKWWNVDTVAVKFSFMSGTSTGEVKGNGSVNLKNLNYRMALDIKKFNLDIIQQYLKDLSNYGRFSANVDANVKATGNINDNENINASGMIAFNDFHLGKTADDDYVSFSKMVTKIAKLAPKDFEYNFDSIVLTKPYIKYEIYDKLDNLERMFGKGGSDIRNVNAQRSFRFNLIIAIADYVKVVERNFFMSNYKIGRLALYNGSFQFNDFSLNEKFSINANPLNITADSISKKNKRVAIFLRSNIKPYGDLAVDLSINPNDTGEFDLSYHLRKLPVAVFNPYVITFTSFPLDRGTLELNGIWKVRNSKIQSDNHLVIIDPRLAVRLKRKEAKRLPVPLLLAFIRERDNLIEYEIPVKGDLKDPKFNLWNVVFKLLGNILIKPPSIPFISHVKHVESEVDKFMAVVWMTRQTSISPAQKEFLTEMHDFLKKNPEASITVTPEEYDAKEKEYILFFEAKKKYWLVSHKTDGSSLSIKDSSIVDKMNVKDSLFVHYLNKHTGDSMMFTLQERCNAYIGKTGIQDSGKNKTAGSRLVEARYSQLVKTRENSFLAFFKEPEIAKRIHFQKAVYSVPYNGFSFYKIDYKGDIPKNLKKAYSQMNELNGNR
jgi:Domain of Unknown Function (DUF748)